MKELAFNKEAWHFWIANFGKTRVQSDDWNWSRPNSVIETDICAYTRAFLIGLFQLIIVSSIVIGIASSVAYAIGNIIGVYLYGYELSFITKVLLFLASLACMVTIGLVTVLATLAGVSKIKEYVSNKLYENQAQEPGFIRVAYSSWKNKYCMKIKITAGE